MGTILHLRVWNVFSTEMGRFLTAGSVGGYRSGEFESEQASMRQLSLIFGNSLCLLLSARMEIYVLIFPFSHSV